MSKLYHNSKYLLAPSLILVSLAGVIVGGPFAWTGVVLLFVGILIDTAIRKQSSSTMHGSDGETLANPAFQNMVMYMMLPVFVLLQLALAWRVYGYMTGMPVEVTSMIWGVIPFTSGITGLDLSLIHISEPTRLV